MTSIPRHNRELGHMIASGQFDKRAMVPMGDAAAMMPADPAAMDPAAMDPAMAAGAVAAPMPGDPAALAASGAMPADPAMAAIQQQAGVMPPEGGAAPASAPAPSGGTQDPALVDSIVAAMQKAGIGANGQAKTFNQWLGEAVAKIAGTLGIDVGTPPPDESADGGSSSSKKK